METRGVLWSGILPCRGTLASRRSTVAVLGSGAALSLPGICAGSVTASSSHPGRNAWRAGSRASRGERLRAAAAGRHASLRIQDRLENTPSMSEADEAYNSASYRSQ